MKPRSAPALASSARSGSLSPRPKPKPRDSVWDEP
jgi:hypothetical protein